MTLTDSFAEPATPVRLLTPALVTSEEICLHAKAMLLSTMANSASSVPLASSCSGEPNGIPFQIHLSLRANGVNLI